MMKNKAMAKFAVIMMIFVTTAINAKAQGGGVWALV